jgi:hypothetical protein
MRCRQWYALCRSGRGMKRKRIAYENETKRGEEVKESEVK